MGRLSSSLVISLFLFHSVLAQEDKEPVVELVMDGPVYAIPMPKYPYDEEAVKQIRESLQAIPDFTVSELYFGNNQSYVPCISVKLNLKSVKAVDSAYVRTIQNKILACFPASSGSIITLMYFKDKPFIVARASKDYSQLIYYPVDSVKARVMKAMPDLKRLQANSEIKSHRMEAGYVGLRISERTVLSYVEMWLQSADEKGQMYFSKYRLPYESDGKQHKSELDKPIPLTAQAFGFSADIKEMIGQPDSFSVRYLYYRTPTGDLVEKSLNHVDKDSERYTEYFLKVF